jgi:hypothetical protein
MIGQIGHSTFEGNDMIRATQIDVINKNPNALLGPATYDIDLSDEDGDTLHFKSDIDMAEFARRWYFTINKEFYGASDGYGPKLDSTNLEYDVINNKIIVPFLDESLPILNSNSPITPSSFDLKNDDQSIIISDISIVGDAIEISPLESLNTSEEITLTYASLNSAVGNVIYDSNNLPAQPFYDVSVHVRTLSDETYGINDFKIYPNPVKENIFLSFSNNLNNSINIIIIDVFGKEILKIKKETHESIKINIASLSRGIYFLKATINSSEFIKKIIIE